MYSTMVSLAFLFVLLTHGAQGLSCFCQKSRCKDPNLLKQECKGGLTDDVCVCCKTCAKVEGETCGGFWGFEGTCDEGLFCKGGHTWRMTKGICTRRATTTPTLATTEISLQIIERRHGSGDGESEATELSTWDDTERPTTPEAESSGDKGADDSDDEDMEPTASIEWIWSPTLKSEATVETAEDTEIPTSTVLPKTTEAPYSGDESGDGSEPTIQTSEEMVICEIERSTTMKKLSKSYSGDGSGGDDDSETERRTSTTWAWLPTLRSEPTVPTTKETEIPTSSEDDENIVIF